MKDEEKESRAFWNKLAVILLAIMIVVQISGMLTENHNIDLEYAARVQACVEHYPLFTQGECQDYVRIHFPWVLSN